MSVERIDTLVVGGGQAGLAMSEHLSSCGVPHLVLERHRIAERWRSERWDSLVANGPAWHDRFPGMEFTDVEPDAFAPKHRWAMDWYYPVLAGVIQGDEGREHLAARRDTFIMEGKGVRCVSDRPWVTAAETCACAMAHPAGGEEALARELFGFAHALRADDGFYWTGIVYPELVHFPGEEQSTYTAATVVLAADALAGTGPASSLFTDHARLPAIIDTGDTLRPADPVVERD